MQKRNWRIMLKKRRRRRRRKIREKRGEQNDLASFVLIKLSIYIIMGGVMKMGRSGNTWP